MSQELIPQPITVLIPSEDVQKYESGEISLETLKRGKNGRFIKQLDTLKADNSFYSKNTTIQVLNNYIFTESLYSKKLKSQINEISNTIKKNEQLSEKIIQFHYNEIEAKVITFNKYLEENTLSNPIFTNTKVIEIGIDTISTLTANFISLAEDFINSTNISYERGREKGNLSLLDFNRHNNKKYFTITKTKFENFSNHIIYFLTLSLLNTLNDVNIVHFKETGKLLRNSYSDISSIKGSLINTLNTLIAGFKDNNDIYEMCYHTHDEYYNPLYNIEKIIQLDKRDDITLNKIIVKNYPFTSSYSHKNNYDPNYFYDSNRVQSLYTLISLIDLCDAIINKFQILEEMQEENPDFNQLLLELSEYTITFSESGNS